MQRTRVACLVLALLAWGCSSGPGYEPEAGDVAIDEAPGRDDRITFYFAGGTGEDEARSRAEGLMSTTGLEVGDASFSPGGDDRMPRVRFHTSVPTTVSGWSRSIAAADMPEAEGRLLLELGPFAAAEGEVRLLEESRSGRVYEAGEGGVSYGYSPGPITLAVLLLLVLLAVPFVAMRGYVSVQRKRDLPKVDKAHRIQRLLMFIPLAGLLTLVPAFLLLGVVDVPAILLETAYPRAPEGLYTAVTIGWMLIAIIGITVGAVLPAQSYVRELRNIERSRGDGKRVLRGLLIGFLPLLLWLTLLSLLRGIAPDITWIRPVAYIGFFLLMLGLGPFLIAGAFGRADMDPSLREKLLAFAHQHGFKVRDVRAIKGRKDKHGNALVVGVLPRLKYIFLTDYLIEQMDEDELMAVVAHEVGHGKKRHTLVKIGVPFLSLLVVGGLMVGLIALDVVPDGATPLLFVLLPVMVVVSIIVAQGVVGIRLEHSADDFACEKVGPEPTARALEKLAEMNMAKKDTGRIFNLFAQHPALDDRLGRVRKKLPA